MACKRKYSIAERRILYWVAFCEEKGKMPSSSGILDLLHGNAELYEEEPLGWTLQQGIRSRGLHTIIKGLLTSGELECVYSPEQEERYFKLTSLGRQSLESIPLQKQAADRPSQIKRKKFIDI